MKVYFVRHAESTHNAAGLHQNAETELSPLGKRQAEILRDRIKSIPVDIIIASPFVRTQQTTAIINEALKKEVLVSDLLREAKRPTELEGREKHEPEVVRIKKLVKEHDDDPRWHYSDEENIFDLRRRAIAFVEWIEKRREASILVVTHGHIVRTAIAVMVWGREVPLSITRPLLRSFRLSNAGITLCEFDDQKGWRLITWNDHAHLG